MGIGLIRYLSLILHPLNFLIARATVIEVAERERQEGSVFLIRLILERGLPIIDDVLASLSP